MIQNVQCTVMVHNLEKLFLPMAKIQNVRVQR